MARDFSIIFADGDKEANWILNRYEETLFLPEDADRPVVLDKTRTQGDLYRSVKMGGQQTCDQSFAEEWYAPLVFGLRLLAYAGLLMAVHAALS